MISWSIVSKILVIYYIKEIIWNLFALSNKIDLEIDGKQHKLEDRKKHDRIRDERLIKIGWKVYRIEWKDLRKNKEYIKEEINKFLEWYNKNK